MKKFLALVLCAVMALSVCAFAEEAAPALTLNREVTPDAYVGTWVLTAAYVAEDGIVAVPENALTIEIKTDVTENLLVDMEKYIHADATGLKGTLTFDEDIYDDEMKLTVAWDGFATVNVVGEGDCRESGAAKCKIQDDDEGLFVDVITGKDDMTCDDIDLMNVIGITTDGNLIIGYSEDHIEKDDEAEWAYAYIFTKAE